MHRLLLGSVFALIVAPVIAQETASPDPIRFRAQGEYVGELIAADGVSARHGAQVVALGAEGVGLVLRLYPGGLPGDGWVPDGSRPTVEGKLVGSEAKFAGDGWVAILKDGMLAFADPSGTSIGSLQRVERASPTLGAAPPPDAAVLFDGSSADAFEGGKSDGGLLQAGCESKRGFADSRIHLEFRTPYLPEARGQARGNSGVYVQGRYECQILDSFGLDGEHDECGGIYSVARPIVNACLPPETWQTYDISFTAARFDGDRKVADARMTVHLNGVLVHDDVAVPNATGSSRRGEGPEPAGLYLQDHGNPVVFRNIWVVERDPARTRRVVFLAGRRSHGYGAHEHRAGCMLLAAALEASGLDVTTEVVDIWPEDESVLDRADVIVSYADGGNGHPLLRSLGKVDELMARGIGLVCLHYAVEVPIGPPGERFLEWTGGYFETDWSVNPHWTAGFVALPEHPIGRGVAPFAINDEWYFHMRFRPAMESVTPILTAIAPDSTMEREDGPHSGNPHVRADVASGVPQHVAWARVRPDGGRGFGFTGAHVHWNWAHDDFRKVVLNAIVWCAQLPVPDGGVRSATPDLAALQANQDYEPGDGFDAAGIQRLLDSFKTRR